ncbi:hypothetical protein DFJ58DRAFT_845706 [Suillus subalutaceus]|uniref:uncharacterized protein n=1 Tax=Suillus subalutaceus TaxID=48586 RepID=UPI001B871501|nr:uncharacterized protein DFJ58DRAFT_845706 [Suillus subalutaceus]KAG1839462.1 hypothetical protein DFJ58DRAFT_845706 [Suillus subalutaceus]
MLTKENVPGTYLLGSLTPTGGLSLDAGALHLGVESAWTRNELIIAGAERSSSRGAEPPTIDQLSTDSWMGALGAPSKASTLSLKGGKNAGITPDDGKGSAAMSISPLLGSVDGLHTSHIKPHIHRNFDLPNDGDLGEVPEFPVLNPIVSVPSTPRIPAELKGKGIDPAEIPHNKGNNDLDPNDWFNQWSDLDEQVAKLSKPGPGELEDSLQGLWDDNNSSVKRAMMGTSPTDTYPSDLDSSSSDEDELLSTESENDQLNKGGTKKSATPSRPNIPEEDYGVDFLCKYLGGQPYRFFERDILDLKKGYSLTEFFEQLFDYIFPPDFRMLQCQKFLDCRQDGKFTVRDYLRRLLDTIEKKALCTERAFLENSRDPNVLLALNPTAAAGIASQSARNERPQSKVSNLQVHSVTVTDTDIRAAAIEEGVAHGLYGMAVSLDEPSEFDAAKRLIVISRSLALLRLAVPLPTDELHDPLYDPYGKDQSSFKPTWGSVVCDSSWVSSCMKCLEDIPVRKPVEVLVNSEDWDSESAWETTNSEDTTSEYSSWEKIEEDDVPVLVDYETSDSEDVIDTASNSVTEEDGDPDGPMFSFLDPSELLEAEEPANELYCAGNSKQADLPDLRSLQ